MLAFAFFAAVFSTMTWLIYVLMYVNDKLGSASLSQLGALDFTIYVAVTVLPILILWMIFGYINQYFNFANLCKNSKILYQQMKKNLDYTDVVARILLETEQEIKSSFILNKFELFILDMNELLADVIQRGSLASSEQIDRLWLKAKNGAKWTFGKVIIEINANQPSFGSRLVTKASNDTVLGGTILEFCARYQNLLKVLEKHDKEKVFLSVIETGVYGKVYSILAPIGEQIRKSRIDLSEECGIKTSSLQEIDNRPLNQDKTTPDVQAERRFIHSQTNEDFSEEITSTAQKTKKLLNIFNPFKSRHLFDTDKEDVSSLNEVPDPFSAALERSFGNKVAPLDDTKENPELYDEYKTPIFSLESEKDSTISIHQLDDIREDEGMPAPSISGHKDNFSENRFFRQFTDTQENNEKDFTPLSSNTFDEDDRIGFTNTRKTLNSLKKEWQEMKSSQEQHSFRQAPQFLRRDLPENTDASLKDEEYAYPFGGWSDVENYDKR